jgi:hypothetical protein
MEPSSHMLRRDPAATAASRQIVGANIKWILLAIVLVAGVAAISFRFQFIHVNQVTVAKCDRWTGRMVFVNFEGKVVGEHPSFDPFRDGQADSARNNP